MIYCSALPTMPKIWDSTMLYSLKQCGEKFRLGLLEGLRPRVTPVTLTAGQIIHRALEIYDVEFHRSNDVAAAARKAVRYVLETTTIRDGAKISFWTHDDSARSRFALVRAVVWYIDEYHSDLLKTYITREGKPALELSFRVQLPLKSPDGDNYLYCGHIDRVVYFGDGLYVLDRKHTAKGLDDNYFSQYNPDAQLTGYGFSANVILPERVTGILVDAIQVGATFNRFRRHPSVRTAAQYNEWLLNTCHWIKIAENMARNNYWAFNETSCHNYGGCQFRPACSKDAHVRASYLTDFHIDRWDPTIVRGEHNS